MERRSRIYPTPKPSVVVEWTLNCADRKELRRAIAEKWSEEEAHTNYRYNVECCADGKRVYLLRPTWLNKGFDFQVNIEGLVKVVKPGKGATREMPRAVSTILRQPGSAIYCSDSTVRMSAVD